MARKNRRSAVSSNPKNTGRTITPQYALEYLNLCLEDSDSGVFLLGLSDLVPAYGAMGRLAQKAGLNREALYNAFSKQGNPELLNLETLLDAMGFRLKIALK